MKNRFSAGLNERNPGCDIGVPHYDAVSCVQWEFGDVRPKPFGRMLNASLRVRRLICQEYRRLIVVIAASRRVRLLGSAG
jgi:hypothetical protein